MSRGPRSLIVLVLASLAAACGQRDRTASREAPASSSPTAPSASVSASGGAPATSDGVRRFHPDPPADPSGSSGLVASLPPGATSAEATALGWALLEGRTPPDGLTQAGFDPTEPGPPPVRDPATQRSNAQIRLGGPTVEGPLTPEQVTSVVNQHRSQFQLCDTPARKRKPAIEGIVAVRFSIDSKGKASRATRDSGSTYPDAEAVACVLRAFEAMSFPPSARTGLTRVLYPVIIVPPARERH